MIHALVWSVVVLFLALWSLTAWALHGLAVWAVTHAGALTGAATDAAAITVPPWLAPWVPADLVQAVTQTLAALGPWIDGLLQAMPMLAGAVTVLAWGLWAVGVCVLMALGVGGHVLVTMVRRRRGADGTGPGAAGWAAR